MAVKIVLIRAGVRDLLRGPEVMADLRRRGQRIASNAGPEHQVDSFTGRNRARVTVRTMTDEAALAEQHHRRLSNALGAGR